jgi:hypothetical protein
MTEGLDHGDHLRGMAASLVDMADVKLSVEGREYLAHTSILAARSPLLSDLFAETFKTDTETASKDSLKEAVKELPVVVLGEGGHAAGTVSQPPTACTISTASFQLLLELIYHPYCVADLQVILHRHQYCGNVDPGKS